MKNYELIALLMDLPAGYNISFGRTVMKEEMLQSDSVFFSGSVEDIETSDTDKMITLLS